jgi:hypothetical protein
VRNTHDAAPRATFGVPLIVALEIDARHATPVGTTGVPPAVTLTEAVTLEPAFGAAGASFTALATTVAVEPPPPVAVRTSNVSVKVLLDRSGSGCSGSTAAHVS